MAIGGPFNASSYGRIPAITATVRSFDFLVPAVLNVTAAGVDNTLLAAQTGKKIQNWGYTAMTAGTSGNSFNGIVKVDGETLFAYATTRQGPMMVRFELPIEVDISSAAVLTDVGTGVGAADQAHIAIYYNLVDKE